VDELLAEPTLCSAFLRAAELYPERPSLRQFGSEQTLTLGEWAARAGRVAGGLRALGIGHGDRVALLVSTRLDFHIVDMGAVLAGCVPFSMYLTSPVAQLRPCIENAQPRVLISEAALAGKARELGAVCPTVEHLVMLEEAAPGELSLQDLEQLCPTDFDVWAVAAEVSPGDLCSLLYTSGTSGPPKGVCYVHRALMATMRAIDERVPVTPDGATLSYLPMAHIAERLFSHYAAFVFGYSVTALGDMTALVDALREVRPTRFFGVPRTWEKLLMAIEAQASAGDGARRAGPVGLERAEWACIAGAPADHPTVEAFHAMGVRVNELYGMSETIMTTMASPEAIRIGWAGPPLPGCRSGWRRTGRS
jgi:long-subunit acyl-CoA synthetase (AMP-forming)